MILESYVDYCKLMHRRVIRIKFKYLISVKTEFSNQRTRIKNLIVKSLTSKNGKKNR